MRFNNAILALIKCQGHRHAIKKQASNNLVCIMTVPEDLSVQYFSILISETSCSGILNCSLFIMVCFGLIIFHFYL